MTDTNTAQMVVDLRAADSAVEAKGWVAPGLGVPGAPLSMLSSALNPLGGLAAAGLSWFMPLVSFLGEPLTQLQGGNEGSVASGSQDFDNAGQDIAGVAGSYRQSAGTQTSEWSGTAATEYRDAAAQHADGVEGLGEASNTVGSAIIGAGQVVAQAIAEVTQLIAEAVAQIVPIMTQAIARAGETFGQSVVEAIPPCVAIAVEYALRIAAKLAALVASGNNLLKLVEGALGVVDLIKAAMTTISKQSVESEATAAGGGGAATDSGAVKNAIAEATPGSTPAGTGAQSASPSGSGGGSGSGVSSLDNTPGSSGSAGPSGSRAPLDIGTRSSGYVPPVSSSGGAAPDASRFGGGGAGGGLPSGGASLAAAPLAPGARVGGERAGGDTTRQENRQQQTARQSRGGGGGVPGAMPMGAMGAARPGNEDKEHQRKVTLVENHEEEVEVGPAVIANEQPAVANDRKVVADEPTVTTAQR